MPWGSREEVERKRRRDVSIWAYAYEFLDESLVSDAEFDRECQLIDPTIATGNDVLDAFFRDHFVSYSGQWVHHHPDLAKLDALARAKIAALSNRGDSS